MEFIQSREPINNFLQKDCQLVQYGLYTHGQYKHYHEIPWNIYIAMIVFIHTLLSLDAH